MRSGHTEAALDLCRLAGRRPAAALCELVNDDGTMQRVPDLLRFAEAHDLPIISIDARTAANRRSASWASSSPRRVGKTPPATRRFASSSSFRT